MSELRYQVRNTIHIPTAPLVLSIVGTEVSNVGSDPSGVIRRLRNSLRIKFSTIHDPYHGVRILGLSNPPVPPV